MLGFLFIFAATYSHAQAQVTAKLDTTAIQIGGQTTLHLSIKSKAGIKSIKWPAFTDTITEHIEIVEAFPIDTVKEGAAGDLVQQQAYIITSFDSGYHAIPPFTFIVNGDTTKTEPLLLGVQSMAVDTTQAFKDIKGVMDEPFSWREYKREIIWTLVSLAVLAAIIIVIIRMKKKKPIIPQKPKVVIPPHITALQSLEQVRAQKLWQEGKTKHYYSAITDILRQYIEERFKVNALEQTTEEILISFRNVVVDNESKSKLKQVLTLADLVKFAKEEPLPQENEMSLSNAFDFVNGTKREEVQKPAEQDKEQKQ